MPSAGSRGSCARHPRCARGDRRAPSAAATAGAGDPASFDALHELLEAQAYRLAYWRVAADEINYRRFFDINDLAALRMENEPVFEATHRFVLELVGEGAVDGLRIDHPDGLFDPARTSSGCRSATRAAARPAPAPDEPLYVVVEKIVAPFENLPENWAVHGTTGYRFANVVNGLFVDGAAEDALHAHLPRVHRRRQPLRGDRRRAQAR